MVWECSQSVLKTGLLALLGSKVLQTGLQSAEPSRRLKFGFNLPRSRVSDQPYMAVSRIFRPSSNISALALSGECLGASSHSSRIGGSS